MALINWRQAKALVGQVSSGVYDYFKVNSVTNAMEVQLALPIYETGITALIGKDDTAVTAQDYSATADITLTAAGITGEILSFLLVSSETSGGAILEPAGWVYIFDADPNTTSGDTSLAAAGAEHKTIVGMIRIDTDEWDADAAGGAVYKQVAIPFHALTTLYVVFRPDAGSTEINSAAGDDEMFDFNMWYRRDS